MPVYRSAQGRQIDMSQLAAKNEKVRAVGNKNVNARGDTIDGHNRIITNVNRNVKNNYNNTVKNETIVHVPQPTPEVKKQEPVIEPVKPPIEEMTEHELEFEQEDISDKEIQELKKIEKKHGSKKTSI